MTADYVGVSISPMGDKPGRRPGTPADYQDALKLRLYKARGQREQSEMAAILTVAMGRHISRDTYRKWESESMLPHDAILPVCDIGRVHPFEFLGPVTEDELAELKKSAGRPRKVHYLKPVSSASSKRAND